MNKLTRKRRAQVIAAMVQGNSKDAEVKSIVDHCQPNLEMSSF